MKESDEMTKKFFSAPLFKSRRISSSPPRPRFTIRRLIAGKFIRVKRSSI